MKPPIKYLAGLMLAASLGSGAQAAEFTLKVHHFLSPKAPTHTKFIVPWAKRVEKQSKGRIKFEIFPSMSLGGKPPDLYQQVRDGQVDIAWTLIGYTPGAFPRTEVFELPTVHRGSARITNQAIQDNFDLIADDYTGLVPILVHVHAGNALHMRDKPVRSVADLQGLRLRTPSRTGAWLIEAFGAEPVRMPVPALPQALTRGTVDGALIPFEIVYPLRLYDLTQYSVEGEGRSRFGTSVFIFVMNRERYESLPRELKAVISANSGHVLAEETGLIWDLVELPGRAAQEGSGSEVINVPDGTEAEFDRLGEEVVDRWIADAQENGIDGRALVAAARNSINIYTRR